MTTSEGASPVVEFVNHLQHDPELLDAIQNRPQRPASLNEALNYAVQVAAERGFSFSRDELVEALRDARPNQESEQYEAARFNLTVGPLGFQQVLVGLSNPSEMMCQLDGPLTLLAQRSIDIS
jgi:hypothetical protein